MLIETHAHLDFPDYDNDRDEVIARAQRSGISAIVNVSSSYQGCISCAALARRYDYVYAAFGMHPHHASEANEDIIQDIRNLISSTEKTVAIGEIGLDYYRNLSDRDTQQKVFVKFLEIARDLNLPAILHCREDENGSKDASRLLLDTIRSVMGKHPKAVMHCFSGDEALLRECLDMGIYLSFTCNVTFKKADRLREIVRLAPIENIFLETDCPYLAPQAKRGERNEPSYLSYLSEAVAAIKGISREEVEEVTSKNAKRFFNIA